MAMYDKLKSLYEIVKGSENFDAIQLVIELQEDALDMEKKISTLKDELATLKKNRIISDKIERHDQPYLTLKNEPTNIRYCAHCWDAETKLIQMNCLRNGCYYCPHCKSEGIYDLSMYKAFNGITES